MNKLDDTLANYFSGNASEEEIRFVDSWKADHEQEFSALKEAWEVAKSVNYQEFDTDKAWTRFSGQMSPENSLEKESSSNYRWWLAAAASVVLLIAAGVSYLWIGNNQPSMQLAKAEKTPLELVLPDGSKVHLNAESELRYATNFDENRTITLSGEAFFEVSRDEKHPFEITTTHGTVTVLGTSFNVEEGPAFTTVAVASGKVQLANAQEALVLEKDQAGQLSTTSLENIEFQSNQLGWHTGEFNFTDVPLSLVLETLNEHYSNRFVWSSTSSSTCSFTAKIANHSAEEVLEILVLSCNLKVQKIDGKFHLSE